MNLEIDYIHLLCCLDVITSTAIINSTRIVKVTATSKDDMKVTQTSKADYDMYNSVYKLSIK